MYTFNIYLYLAQTTHKQMRRLVGTIKINSGIAGPAGLNNN